jgi:hypothetical protein
MKRLICALLFLFPSLTASAAAYWLEVIGSGKLNEVVRIQLCYGNIDDYSIRHRDKGKELKLTGDFRLSILDNNGKTIQIPISLKEDCWEGTYTPTLAGAYRIFAVNDSHPVVDRSKTGGKNVRPVDYLCSIYEVGSAIANTAPNQLLDITTERKDGIILVKAFKNALPLDADTKLRVFNPENWEKELTVNVKGETFFKPTLKGLYIIRQDWDDAKPGAYKDVAYSSTRYRCNYCLLVR